MKKQVKYTSEIARLPWEKEIETKVDLECEGILLDLFLAVKDGDFSNGEWNFDAYDRALNYLRSCGKLTDSDL